jgi:O-6-methylguanine DNA methyltransferase
MNPTIYYDVIFSKVVGSVLLAATADGLCAVVFGKGSESQYINSLSALSPGQEINKSTKRLEKYSREFASYFLGKREVWTLPLDYSLVATSFQKRILSQCFRIAYGRITSYGELASKAGYANAARAAGNALGANPLPIIIPCHRVIASSGHLGGYSGGLQFKKKLLLHEGVTLERSTLKNLLTESIRRK